jgi:hypothetical protein
MPFWSPEQENIDFSIILDALKNIDVSGAVGFPKISHTRAATVELDGTRSRIIPAVDDTIREIFIRNTTNEPLIVFLETQNIKIAEVEPGGHCWDTFNSGVAIEVIGTGTIEVMVRQDKPINYGLGKSMVFPVGVALTVGTGDNFGFVTQAFQDDSSSTFNQNISKLFNSNEGITGHKIAIIHTFTPGLPIEFTVQTEGGRYDTSQGIQFQWINEIMALRLALAVGSDVMNPESELLADGIGGLLTKGGYAGEAPGTGGALTLKPNFMNLRGRFVAVDTATGYYDTAIITHYEPNSDPLKGGTFTLEGF